MLFRRAARSLSCLFLACCGAAQAALDEPQQLTASDISLVREYSGIPFDRPLWFATAPGDSQHYFVIEQDGRILSFNRSPSTSSASVFLDIRDRVTQLGGERGLLGLAFDPGYASNGRFFVNYNTDTSPLLTAIARFTKPGDSASANPDSELRLLTFQQPGPVHKAGWIAVGPDGRLYTSTGDGGTQPDATNTSPRLDLLLGKILRIERSGAIPADNPFVGTPGARGEIWAYGLRNPFRAAFDAVTGTLWVGDVGSSRREEIDLIQRGRNYGWPTYEGTLPLYNPSNLPLSHFAAPLHEYPHTDGCAIVGGRVYRGSAIPALQGRYVYTDYCSGTLWALQQTNGTVTSNIVLGTISGNPSSIGEDENGELRVTTLSGRIYRIAPGSGSVNDGFPALLSQTGMFQNTVALVPAHELVEYALQAPFWSDRANKRRWIRLPDGGRIDFDPLHVWRFPVGSTLVKHFEMTLASGSVRRLETRLLERTSTGWRGASYRWNQAGTDAALVTGTQTESLQVMGGAGKSLTQTYEYPSQGACLRCHTSAAGYVLGLTTPQLNRSFEQAPVNQLTEFADAGMFSTSIGDPSNYSRLANPYNPAVPLSARARAWLHANCAQCHRPNGPTGTDMDLRWTTPIGKTNVRDVAPSGETLGIPNARRIAPGSPARSLVLQRMRRLDEYRMPPLGSHAVDARAVELLTDWIAAGAH